MRFSYAEAMIDPALYVPLAQAVEDAGYDSMIVPDSICYPQVSDAKYPYTPDGDRSFIEGKPFIEPFVLMGGLGAVTTNLRFVTSVIKLTIRDPVLVAKQATSVAVLTGGRLALGVGTSPWPEDYAITGVPWAGRGKRTDEMMQIISGLMSGEYFGFDGEFFHIPEIKLCPVPERPVPLLVGGHAEPALRRAAQRSDGWVHGGGGDGADLGSLIGRLRELRADSDRVDEPFEIHVISLDAYDLDGIRRLEDMGVTDVIVGFRYPYTRELDAEPLQTKVDALRTYAENVMSAAR